MKVKSLQSSTATLTQLELKRLNSVLFKLIKKRARIDKILALIKKGADVNARDSSGARPLIEATEEGLTDVCITLINCGADVNAHDGRRFRMTPLSRASARGHKDLSIILLRLMLIKQLLDADPEGGDLTTRKMRMRCAIMTLKRTNLPRDLITLILKSKPLSRDYTACRYHTYCCCPGLTEYFHSITRDWLCVLLGQKNIDVLKATFDGACHVCRKHPALKNLLNPINFEQYFNDLFLFYIPLIPIIREQYAGNYESSRFSSNHYNLSCTGICQSEHFMSYNQTK